MNASGTLGWLGHRLGSCSNLVAPLDVPWLLVESDRQPTHVAGVVILDKPSGAEPTFVDDLSKHMAGFDCPSVPFNRKLGGHMLLPFWPRWLSCPQVRVADHFHSSRLTQPGGPRQLEQEVAVLHRVRLDSRRPLWDVHLIDGLRADQFAIYAKFHHSLVDGVGAIRILQAGFSTDAATRGLPPVWAYAPQRRVTRTRPARRSELLRALPTALRGVTDNFRRPQAARPYSAPATALNTPISSERVVGMVSLELGRLRGLAAVIDGSVNDAFVLVCATALRNYLLEHGLLPRRALTAAMPVSVRPAGKAVGNAITFAFISLATDVADHAQRAARIVASTRDSKSHLRGFDRNAISIYTVLTMAPLIVSQILGLGAVLPPMFNIVISSVPGPRERLYYEGAPVRDIFPVSLLQSGQALNITALSYEDRLNVTFTGCDARLPELDRLTSYCADALNELDSATTTANDAPGPV